MFRLNSSYTYCLLCEVHVVHILFIVINIVVLNISNPSPGHITGEPSRSRATHSGVTEWAERGEARRDGAGRGETAAGQRALGTAGFLACHKIEDYRRGRLLQSINTRNSP